VSRGGARQPAAGRAARPVWVWLIYGLGICGATMVVLSALFTTGASLGDAGVSFNVSLPAMLVWGGLAVVGGATWVWRRRRRPGS
jgi:LPXTG-motif cell wall-anchored protein